MASSGHFDPSKTYDGYSAVEVLDPYFTEFLKKGRKFFQNYNTCSSKYHHCFIGKKPCQYPGAPLSDVRRYLWSKKNGPFGKEFPVPDAPTPDVTSGYSDFKKRDVARWTNVGGPIPICGRPIYSSSEVPISRIKSQGLVKRLRIVADSPTNPDAGGSDHLDGEEVEVVPNSIGHQASASPSQPASRISQSQVIPITPRNFQQILSTIPPPSPNLSTSRPAFVSPVRPSPLLQPRNSAAPNNYNLCPAPVEEEKIPCLFYFLQPNYFTKENIGLSGLPEIIQIW
ncbi:hypothetical protein O181_027713 [Austropuccinia psidii MF-1]|uniref:Uncharacterized protein n=1 Tax=Austropuccinia psidii MF-1 TaxID=1389203 RepID=A0A9Q3CQ34_9BASI|nr:hypothetical protein [Austropuccinia psidii MF-1]